MAEGRKTTVREEVDRFVGMLRRCLVFWKRSTAVFVIIAGAAFAFVMTAPRTFKSETVIVYQEAMRSSDLLGGAESATENARRAGARLREVLLSRAVLEPLITELRLYPALVDKRGLVDAVDEMRKHITFRAREGDTFEIAFESNTKESAKEVTQRLADCIVQEASSRRTEQAKTLKEFLDAESDRNKIELRAREGDLARFLALHPEFARPTLSDVHSAAPLSAPPDVAGGGGDPLLAALEWKAAKIDRQLKAGAGKVDPQPPKAAGKAAKLPDSAELVAARKDVEDKAGRFTDKHPDVIASRARLRNAEAAQAAAQAAADRAEAAAASDDALVKPATDDNREALTGQLADLRLQIAARRAAIGAAPAATGPRTSKKTDTPAAADSRAGAVDLEVDFRRLQREANDARERQKQLDERQFKASITASSVLNERNIQVAVLDPAYLPTHASSRPRSTTLAVGVALAFVLAFLTALGSARLDDRIYDRTDLEMLDLMPVLAVIPPARPGSKKSA